ncbi:hypothetical protein TIFTF001_045482 [Ficus carica]|uniref:Uncharacterized protein n=1 Tax=Ficus carica TaxID=3494 RepID=A0AA87Z052_FICCA|nr:hypothetical protein TIFTF001_045480 [Ficus carica]GMN21360.1 hypothetical protein TIFTF001_045482 [Ficus carica]
MVRPRTRANQNPQESDLANVIATLQRQLMEQQRETDRLREQIARFDQISRANVVPPQENPVPPVVPQVPEGHQEVPQNVEVPLAPIGVQTNPPLIREDMLYERFRAMYYNREILAAQQDEFNSFRQGSMTVIEAVKSRAIRAECWINQDKEARAQIFKAKKEEKAVAKQPQPRQNSESDIKGQSSNAGKNPRQFGKNQQGNYSQKKINRVKIECPHLAQERLEVPEPQTRYHVYTKGDIEAGTSSVAIG